MVEAEKIDVFKLHKEEYKAGKTPQLVQSQKAMYLSVEGQGQPGSEDFSSACNALYSMAYTMKMGRKADGKGDYTICKLECLYWTADGKALDPNKMEEWNWRLMIRTPKIVGSFPITDDDLQIARTRLEERKKAEGCERVVLHHLKAARFVQMLHVGPYDKEMETIDQMLEYCEVNGLKHYRAHHEIYISDPRRVKPEKLKTILRLLVE